MALIKCRECGKEVSDKAKKCVHCGCPIEKENIDSKVCNNCGYVLNKNDKFCPECGESISNTISKNDVSFDKETAIYQVKSTGSKYNAIVVIIAGILLIISTIVTYLILK